MPYSISRPVAFIRAVAKHEISLLEVLLLSRRGFTSEEDYSMAFRACDTTVFTLLSKHRGVFKPTL